MAYILRKSRGNGFFPGKHSAIPIHLCERQNLRCELRHGCGAKVFYDFDRSRNAHAWILPKIGDISAREQDRVVRPQMNHAPSQRRMLPGSKEANAAIRK